MPDIPGGQESVNEGKAALVDGAVFALGTGVGQAVAGGIGHGIGGILAGASIGGTKGETLSTLAVGQGLRRTMFSGGGGGSGRRVK